MQNEEFSVEDLSGLCFWVLYLQACFVIAWMADKTVGKQNYTDDSFLHWGKGWERAGFHQDLNKKGLTTGFLG